ncbi:thymidylate synthase [Pseudomonas sp. efr-133-TYG-103a]|uniref:thymidylate synthase n=1 Tax=Pseudomonas sp. efr-133-TYG-103a TaxID=3040308 RepID=UPI002555F1FD|nr:thymidylate synthase [Pseudomonas sp. efr-133-TYG-103a]
MHIFIGNDLNDVYFDSLLLSEDHTTQSTSSRVGTVYDFGPAYFQFNNPKDQILTLRNRGFNPYFAVVEAAWVLSGKNTLSPLQNIISNYSQYSDDGKTLNGAYGFRLKQKFGYNQLSRAIELLKKTPSSRRAVITLYSPEDLVETQSLDIPCNTTIYVKIRNNKLDLTVLNRSNDLFKGIPYNVFVFNCIQKYIARNLNIELGIQRHFTDSLHLYESDLSKVKKIIQTNSPRETAVSKAPPSSSHIYNSILLEYDFIAEEKIDNIQCSYTRQIFDSYFSYRTTGNAIDLIKSLPYDQFGLSAKLWAESFNQKAK